MRDVLLVLHIVAVAAWLGANIAQVVTTRRLVPDGGQTAAAWMETTVHWGRVLYTPAAIVILATGIGLVLESSLYDFSHAFVAVGFMVVIIGAALAMTMFAKGGARAAAAFAAGDTTAGKAEVKKIMPWGILDTLLLVIAVFAMVNKWGV